MPPDAVELFVIYAEEKSQGEKTKREKAHLDRVNQAQVARAGGRFY